MKKCVLCGLPQGKFNVTLNAENICNYCTFFEKNQEIILNVNNRKYLLNNRFAKLRGKYNYDAVVGLSGGKDSTFVLFKLVNEYKLKVLAVTYDNGFLTDFAKKSIKKIIKRLQVDHIYYKPNMKILKKFYKAAVKSYGDPCIACSMGGYFLSIKKCHELRIPFFVHGRSPYQMYRNYYEGSSDLFLPMMELNLEEHSFAKIAQVYTYVHEILKDYVRKMTDTSQDAEEIINEFFIDSAKLTKDFVPEFLAYFLFNEYDEKKIKNELSEAIGWKKHSNDQLLGHYDCAIHDAAGYAYKEIHGVSDLVPDLAVMIRFDAFSKQKAEEILAVNKLSDNDLNRSMDALFKLCGWKREALFENINSLKEVRINKFASL